MTPVVFAHGLVGRADLPIPAGLFGAAAAVVLVVSFAALAAGWSRPRLEDPRERELFRIPRALEVACGAIGIALFAIVVYAGLAGTDIARDNLTPTAVYVLFWVGIPVLSLVLGDVFRPFNPWRAIGRAVGWIARRAGGAAGGEPLRYPERLGRWPAVAGILAFGAVELCWGRGNEPDVLAVLALGYAALQLVGMGLYGVEEWSRRGDAFGTYFGAFATLAPLGSRDGRIVARLPGSCATRIEPVPGTVALLVVAIGITMFDGAKEGPVFGGVAPDLQEAFVSVGASKAAGLELAFLLGLLASVALVSGLYRLGAAGAGRGMSGRFAHSLVPIVAAYVVAHYFSLLAYQGQALWSLASDPLGEGSDLFGTAARQIDYGVVSATGIWYVQLVALVVGHVLALVLAHDRALTIHGTPRAATRSQLAMLGAMVAFTCLGLWQLSVANA